jgi:hypothetical protein
MKTLIEKIWDEEYKPGEECVLFGEEIVRANHLLDEKEKELWEKLNDENKKLFDKVMSHYYEMVSFYKKDAFVRGARFVGRMMKEIEM